LSRDELEAALRATPDHDWLEDSFETDGRCQARRGLRLEASPWLSRVRVDRLDGEMQELGLTRFAQKDLEAAAEAAAFLRNARQAPSPPSSTPARRQSGGRRRSQGDRGSAPPRGEPSEGRSW